jgi:hypothetical protein
MSHTQVVSLYSKKTSRLCRTVNKVLTCNWVLRNVLYIGSSVAFGLCLVGFLSAALTKPHINDPHPYDSTAHVFFILGIVILMPYLLNLLYMIRAKVQFILYDTYESRNPHSTYVLAKLSEIEGNLYKLRRSIGKNAFAKTYVAKAQRAIWEITDESRRYARYTSALKLSGGVNKDKPLDDYLHLAEEIEATTSMLVFRSISLNDSAHLQVVAMELQHCIDSVDELSALHLAA